MNIYRVVVNDEEWFTEGEDIADAVKTVLDDPDQPDDDFTEAKSLTIQAELIAENTTMSEYEDDHPEVFFE